MADTDVNWQQRALRAEGLALQLQTALMGLLRLAAQSWPEVDRIREHLKSCMPCLEDKPCSVGRFLDRCLDTKADEIRRLVCQEASESPASNLFHMSPHDPFPSA
jgi:hypothetical protein